MPRILLAIPKMLENEILIDDLLEKIMENEEVLRLDVCTCSTAWTSEVHMKGDPTVFAVELALSFDGLIVSLRP